MERKFVEPGENRTMVDRIQNTFGQHWTTAYWVVGFIAIMSIVKYHQSVGYDITTSYLIGLAVWGVLMTLVYVIEKQMGSQKAGVKP